MTSFEAQEREVCTGLPGGRCVGTRYCPVCGGQPEQEREDGCSCHPAPQGKWVGRTGPWHGESCRRSPYYAAPPSEADSAGEDERESRRWLQIELDDADNYHVDQAIRWALRRISDLETALAASSGVRERPTVASVTQPAPVDQYLARCRGCGQWKDMRCECTVCHPLGVNAPCPVCGPHWTRRHSSEPGVGCLVETFDGVLCPCTLPGPSQADQ